MNIKKYILISTFFGSLCSMTSAETFYIGGGVGASDFNTKASVGTASLDESGTGFKIYGGWHINDFFSVEYFYNDYGSATLSGSNGQTFTWDGAAYQFTATAEIELSAWATGFTPMIGYEIPINNGGAFKSIRPYAKFGYQFWEAEITETTSSTTATVLSADGWDYIGGLGVFLNFDFNGVPIGIRGEYEQTGTADNTDDISMFSGSIFYNF